MHSYNSGNLTDVAVYKLVLLGNSGVGKTSICNMLSDKKFIPNQEPTIGAAFLSYNVGSIKFQIWDTAGQERYRSLTPMYFRGADVCALVYDVTDRYSFQQLPVWIREIQERDENPILLVIANKIDRADREVDTDTGVSFATKIKGHYFEISAKSNETVTQLFNDISNILKNVPSKQSQKNKESLTRGIIINIKKERGSCC